MNTTTTIQTINTTIRTLMLLAILVALGIASYLVYETYIRPSQNYAAAHAALQEKTRLVASLEARLLKLHQHNERLETANKLLKIDRRLAHVRVLDKGTDDQDQPYIDVEFVEVDGQGQPLAAPRRFTLAGDRLYIDCWVVKFEDRYVEEAEELRSATMFVFKSIWGNQDGPDGGFALDGEGAAQQTAYGRIDAMSDFERQIWEDFWTVSNDLSRQRELGIRASHGQVTYLYVEPGMVYEVTLRASDGVSIRPSERQTSR